VRQVLSAASMTWEHESEAREALRAIVSHPGYGNAALSNAPLMANLLKDYLPDAPRERNVLIAAAEADLASMLQAHVASGLDLHIAARLTAASFAATTAYTPETCAWAVDELALALGLTARPHALTEPQPQKQAQVTEEPGPLGRNGQTEASRPAGQDQPATVTVPRSQDHAQVTEEPGLPGRNGQIEASRPAGQDQPATVTEPPPPQPPPPPARRRSRKRWLYAAMAIAAVVAASIAVLVTSLSSPTSSSSSIPLLNSSYSGTYTDTTLKMSGKLTMSNTREDTTTGTFTSDGTIKTSGGTCFIHNTNGRITADGKMTWITDYEQGKLCITGKAYVTAQLHNGVITGSWTHADPSIHDTGTFTLS
jgi:hypothetical protein